MEITFNNLPEAVTQLRNEISEIKRLLVDKGDGSRYAEPDQLLTIQGAAELLHLSVDTIRSYVRKREIPFSRKGKLLYFSRQQLMAWVQEGHKLTKKEGDAMMQKASANIHKRHS